MLLNFLQCTDQAPQQRIIWAPMPKVPRRKGTGVVVISIDSAASWPGQVTQPSMCFNVLNCERGINIGPTS